MEWSLGYRNYEDTHEHSTLLLQHSPGSCE